MTHAGPVLGAVTALVFAAACGRPIVPVDGTPGVSTSTAAPDSEEGAEVTSDGTSSVTVLSRPQRLQSHPKEETALPMTDALCRAAQPCASSGSCTAKATECVAASYADCEQMAACASGMCSFADGRCTVVASCAETQGCRDSNLCAGQPGACAIGDAEGCQASTGCKSDGLCTLDQGACVAKAQSDCVDADVCKRHGQCVPTEGACKALSDRHCERSPVCKDHKRCLSRDGVCVSSCSESENCKRLGRCLEKKTEAGLSCVARRDKDCEDSIVCAEGGHCSASLGGGCEAGDDVECRRAQACREQGRCSAKRGRCLPASDAECRQSTIACARDGRCRHQGAKCVR